VYRLQTAEQRTNGIVWQSVVQQNRRQAIGNNDSGRKLLGHTSVFKQKQPVSSAHKATPSKLISKTAINRRRIARRREARKAARWHDDEPIYSRPLASD